MKKLTRPKKKNVHRKKASKKSIQKYVNKKPKAKAVQVLDLNDEKMRKDWEFNHEVISGAYYKLMIDRKKKPTYKMLMQETGFSYETVRKHVKKLQFKPLESSFRLLTDKVIMALFSHAMRGHPADRKLWFQVMEGWVEKHKMDVKNVGLQFGVPMSPDDAQAEYLANLEP